MYMEDILRTDQYNELLAILEINMAEASLGPYDTLLLIRERK
jgi:hypothetical protein